MADLAASDVTVTLNPQDTDFMTYNKVVMPTIAFGDGALTYPANGVPLPGISLFGMKKAIKRVFIQPPPGDGFVYKYDKIHHTIRIYQGAGGTPDGAVAVADHTHDLTFIGGIAETEAVMIATGDTLGKNAGTDRTIAGADSATKGGVVAKTGLDGTFTGAAGDPAPLVELGHVAIAAKTLDLMVVGD